MWKRKIILLFLFAGCLTILGGCVKRTGGSGGTAGLYKGNTETEAEATGTDAGKGAEELVIVTNIDTASAQITVKRVGDGSLYTLNYTGGTSIQNRYGTELLMQDILPGEVARVRYTPGTQKLISIREAEDAWENTTVSKWSVDYDKKIMTIGSDKYSYDDNLVIISEGRQIDIHELNSVDSLIVKGIDKKLCSVNVKVGHGYIRLTDETNLVGGLVEVGTKLMTVISEGMIIVAPEGTYTLTASKNGVGGSTEIVVNRDDETIVSLSAFQGEVERQGSVKFNIQPEGVSYNVFIDGKAADVSEALPLSYGTHKVVITSDKYTDYTEEIVISSIYMNKTIDLSAEGDTEETEDESTSSEEESTTEGTEETTKEGETQEKETEREDGVISADAATQNREVIISGPAGAEIYQDGIYKGKAPVTIAKSEGSHIFVLRAEGYTTTAYSYTFDSTDTDVYIKFPDMEESDS